MESKANIIDALIIGAGTSGMFIASKLLKLNKSVILLEKSKTYGGQLNLYADKHIYNIPLINCITAKEVSNILYKNLNLEGSKNINLLLNSEVVNCEKINNLFNIDIKNNNINNIMQICCKYIILAVGKGEEIPNKLPIKSAEMFENKTLLYSINDKNVFKNKNVVIAGGGDSAIDWTCELTEIANKIFLIHRRDIVRNENAQFEKFKDLCKKNKIELKIPYSITTLEGDNGILEKVKIINNITNQPETIICDYLLPFYGITTVQTNVEAFKKIGLLKSSKGINVNEKTNETNIENIFAIGDCCNFEGKITNIQNCFNDAMRCLYCICQKEQATINKYEHQN